MQFVGDGLVFVCQLHSSVPCCTICVVVVCMCSYGTGVFFYSLLKSNQDVVSCWLKVGAKCALNAGDIHGLPVPLVARNRSLRPAISARTASGLAQMCAKCRCT